MQNIAIRIFILHIGYEMKLNFCYFFIENGYDVHCKPFFYHNKLDMGQNLV